MDPLSLYIFIYIYIMYIVLNKWNQTFTDHEKAHKFSIMNHVSILIFLFAVSVNCGWICFSETDIS